MTIKKQKLELTWIGKENRPKLEPRILLEAPEKSYHAAHRVTDGDLFDNLQMLWWIQQDALKGYLRFWQQLRQLFRIYRLEEDLWRGITVPEIEQDIVAIRHLTRKRDPEGVHRLTSVLEYLRRKGGAA